MSILNKIHNRLITFVVGKKPVMLNMKIEVEDSYMYIKNEKVLFVNNVIT